MDYHELFKAINAKKVLTYNNKKYTHCKVCEKPRKTENDQKYAICYKCHSNIKTCNLINKKYYLSIGSDSIS
jgi:hypothetical protein